MNTYCPRPFTLKSGRPAILFFGRPHMFLSNHYTDRRFSIKYEDRSFHASEQLYMMLKAQRVGNSADVARVMAARDPVAAKRATDHLKSNQQVALWRQHSIEAMRLALK